MKEIYSRSFLFFFVMRIFAYRARQNVFIVNCELLTPDDITEALADHLVIVDTLIIPMMSCFPHWDDLRNCMVIYLCISVFFFFYMYFISFCIPNLSYHDKYYL